MTSPAPARRTNAERQRDYRQRLNAARLATETRDNLRVLLGTHPFNLAAAQVSERFFDLETAQHLATHHQDGSPITDEDRQGMAEVRAALLELLKILNPSWTNYGNEPRGSDEGTTAYYEVDD